MKVPKTKMGTYLVPDLHLECLPMLAFAPSRRLYMSQTHFQTLGSRIMSTINRRVIRWQKVRQNDPVLSSFLLPAISQLGRGQAI